MAVIRILIDEDTEVGHFRDAIIMEEATFNEIIQQDDPFQEITDLVQERIDTHVENVQAINEEPVPEELPATNVTPENGDSLR